MTARFPGRLGAWRRELFGRLFAYLSTYEAIIAIHTSGQLSGTAAASARTAAALPTADKISVVASRHLSASLGGSCCVPPKPSRLVLVMAAGGPALGAWPSCP